MNLLDHVIDSTDNRESNRTSVQPTPTSIGVSTTDAVAMYGRSIPFRGLLHDVRGASNGELLNRAGLSWKTHVMPVGVIGKTETRTAEGYQALVRGDNGGLLSITSDSFKPHQNADIMSDMQAMAEAGQAEICFAGALDSGRKVVAIAKLEGEFQLPDKRQRDHWNAHAGQQTGRDSTALFVIISGGHEVGTPFKVRGMAFRRWCSNGAFFTANASSTFTRSHRRMLDREREQIRACYQSIRNEFRAYGENAAKLQAVEMQREQSRLYVAELLLPGIAAQLGQRLTAMGEEPLTRDKVWIEVADSYRGRQALNKIIEENEEQSGFARLGKHLIDAIVEQDGANGANLWSGYNGVSWYVDHKRGRNPESGVDASLFGAGAGLKERALETALQFVPEYAYGRN